MSGTWLRQHLDHEGNSHEGAEGGAEIGEHHDEKNPGDLVLLESLEGSDVMVYAQIGRPHSLQIPINAKPRSAHLPGRRYRSSLVLPKWDSASRKDLRKARGGLKEYSNHLQVQG